MSRPKVVDAQPSMDGGLNVISDDAALQPNQLRLTDNARLTVYGAITKRGGTQRTSTAALSAHAVQNGYTWRKDGGTQEILVIVNGVLYTTTWGSFPLTYTAETGTMATTGSPSFAQFRDGTNDVVYIADGDGLNVWDGAALTTDISGATACADIVVHNNRLWGCGNGTAPDSIFYSALNDGDSLGNGGSGGGQIVVRTFGDETVVALASINTSLLIFHRRGISRLTGYGQDDITVAPTGVTADVGLIAKHSVTVVGNLGYFVSERGLYRCDEATVQPVGTPQVPDPLLPAVRALSAAEFDHIRAAHNRATNELWISIPTYGLFIYHTILNAWSGPWNGAYTAPATTTLFETLNASGLPVLLRGDATGWVSLCDAPASNMDNVGADGSGGEIVNMVVQFHRMYCGDDASEKALRWGYLVAQLNGSTSCSVTWNTDSTAASYQLAVSDANTWGTFVWGQFNWGGPSSRTLRVPMGGSGYYINVQIIDSSMALPVFSRFQLEAYTLGRR